jgi:hypothetical protein
LRTIREIRESQELWRFCRCRVLHRIFRWFDLWATARWICLGSVEGRVVGVAAYYGLSTGAILGVDLLGCVLGKAWMVVREIDRSPWA